MKNISRRGFVATSCAAAGAMMASGSRASEEEKNTIDMKRPGRTANTKFACNLEMWWRDRPFLERICLAAELGYPAIEFWPWRGKDIDAAAALTQELGIAVAQFTASGNIANPANHATFVQNVKDAIPVAKKLGAKKACVVAGEMVDGMTERDLQDQCVVALKKVAPMCENNDLMLILEPLNIRVDHPGQCVYRSDDAIRICQEVGSTHVKINWDLYHQQITEGDLCGRLREGFEQIGYLQLADHPGRNEPGTGEIYYPRVLQEAYELGYRGYVGLELRPKTTELAAAIAIAKADIW